MVFCPFRRYPQVDHVILSADGLTRLLLIILLHRGVASLYVKFLTNNDEQDRDREGVLL